MINIYQNFANTYKKKLRKIKLRINRMKKKTKGGHILKYRK